LNKKVKHYILLRPRAEESTYTRNSHHFHPRTRRSRNEIEHTLKSTELFIIIQNYRDGPSTSVTADSLIQTCVKQLRLSSPGKPIFLLRHSGRKYRAGHNTAPLLQLIVVPTIQKKKLAAPRRLPTLRHSDRLPDIAFLRRAGS